MGKMSDLHLALQGIRELCNNAPSPRCLYAKAHMVLNDYENRICQILMYVKDIEDTLSSTQDKKFRFHWKDGTTQEGIGTNPTDALTRMGYGGGSIAALDHYKDITEEENAENVRANDPFPLDADGFL